MEVIRKKILDNNFSFEFVCKSYVNKKIANLVAKITVRPEIDSFNYYAIIEESGKEKCRMHIYNGLTGVFFGGDFFSNGKWKESNEFIIGGKIKEVEIHVLINECKVEFVNLTRYSKPPFFTLMRADVSEKGRAKARQDWEHSFPAVASIIRQAHN